MKYTVETNYKFNDKWCKDKSFAETFDARNYIEQMTTDLEEKSPNYRIINGLGKTLVYYGR